MSCPVQFQKRDFSLTLDLSPGEIKRIVYKLRPGKRRIQFWAGYCVTRPLSAISKAEIHLFTPVMTPYILHIYS